jgi:hypothetical protein
MTDFDANNLPMPDRGAYYRSHNEVGGGWRPMSEAPHDGSVIEVRCTWGVAPWFGLYAWVDGGWFKASKSTPGTLKPGETGRIDIAVPMDGQTHILGHKNLLAYSFDDGPEFTWRSFKGDSASYVDPTGGAQDSEGYWRGAAAASNGLPPSYFEPGVCSWFQRAWERIFGK